MVEEYFVGGLLRDQIITATHGTPNTKKSDIDIAVEASSFEEMKQYIIDIGGKIKVESPQFFTIKAIMHGQPVDYTLCRKEGTYKDGRHPDTVEIGTIVDDLARRDLTINAMARHVDSGELIDPHGGVEDIRQRVIRCCGDVETRCSEDYLRVLRILRFSITLDFKIASDTETILYHPLYIDNLFNTVSDERIREEFTKMFMSNTSKTLDALNEYPLITRKMVRIFNLRPVFK